MSQARPGVLPKSGGERATVTFVQDGDTASLKRGDGSKVNCRIDKIDAPETAHPSVGKKGQAFGEASKQELRQLIESKQVTLRITKPADDKNHGRAMCQIDIEGTNVNLEMVRRGAAWLYRRYSNDPAFIQAEGDAKSNKRGLWADSNPVNPETFRHNQH